MRKARWLAEWAGKEGKSAIYHCISRVVDRRFVFSFGSDAALKSRDNLCFFEDVGVEGFFAF
jgi:hypothetical protein